MRQPEVEAARWIAQAESDLTFAVVGVREGFFAQACFTCQQAGGKALKAVHYARGARIVLGHSLVDLLAQLLSQHPALSELRDAAGQLDQYYISTRYPNGLPGGVPGDAFTGRQAGEAVAYAQDVIARARAVIAGESR